jgi:hypothetical protein
MVNLDLVKKIQAKNSKFLDGLSKENKQNLEMEYTMGSPIRKNIMINKTGTKKKNVVELPTYKVEEKDPTYKLRRGKVMEAHSNLHANKDGKRTITTKMKIWDQLTPSDKADLKKSIMLAIDHKFKGGSISDFPTDIRDIVKAVSKHFVGKGIVKGFTPEQQRIHDEAIRSTGKTEEQIYNDPRSVAIRARAREAKGMGFLDDMNRVGSTLYPQTARNAEDKIRKIREADAKLRARNEQMRQARGQGLLENYFKPKGSRQLIYFSDSSSDEDEPHLPVKRGRGRPKKM